MFREKIPPFLQKDASSCTHVTTGDGVIITKLMALNSSLAGLYVDVRW